MNCYWTLEQEYYYFKFITLNYLLFKMATPKENLTLFSTEKRVPLIREQELLIYETYNNNRNYINTYYISWLLK